MLQSPYQRVGDALAVHSGREYTCRAPQGRSSSLVKYSPVLRCWCDLGAQAEQGIRKRGTRLATALAAASMFSSQPSLSAEDLTISFPASKDPALFAVQKTLVQCWGLVQQLYVDPSFNDQGDRVWKEDLQSALAATFEAPDAASAYKSVDTMLSTLNDPFTRLLRPAAAEEYTLQTEGKVESLGLVALPQVLENGDAAIVVAYAIDGSPAEAAGIQAGDELVAINGAPVAGFSTAQIQKLLDKGSRSEVVVLTVKQGSSVRDVELYRKALAFNPVQYARLDLSQNDVTKLNPNAADTTPTNSVDELKGALGYVRLAVFTNNAGEEMRTAVEKLEKTGVQGYILDLRDNPGGVISAGMDVARLWLSDGQPFTIITGRAILDDGQDELPLLVEDLASAEETRTYTSSSFPVTSPLAIIVNGGSASTSELLAGALVDDLGAVLVGDETTFGKGRTQTLMPLEDGSALLVTTARFFTPKHLKVDGIGLTPEVRCNLPKGVHSGKWRLDPESPSLDANLTRLWDDPCVQQAAGSILKLE